LDGFFEDTSIKGWFFFGLALFEILEWIFLVVKDQQVAFVFALFWVIVQFYECSNKSLYFTSYHLVTRTIE
jgi:hypothetical protein